MFETLVQSESVLQGLREAASLAAQARKSKNGDKMAQVLKMLQVQLFDDSALSLRPCLYVRVRAECVCVCVCVCVCICVCVCV